jgi:hypothetical protein
MGLVDGRVVISKEMHEETIRSMYELPGHMREEWLRAMGELAGDGWLDYTVLLVRDERTIDEYDMEREDE